MEEEGISLRDIWRWFMRKRLVASIIFGVTTILVFIVIMFGYNKMVVKYETRFHYNWLGIEDKAYANGTIFNYYDIIQKEALIKARDTASEFSDVDIEELKDNISIVQKDGEFILTIEGNFFDDDLQARRFVMELIKLPYQKGLELGFDFTSNLKGYQQAIRLNDKLDYLSAQINLMLTSYQNMVNYFGNLKLNGVTLNERLEELEVFNSNQSISEFRQLVYKNAYMSEEEYELSLTRYSVLETERELLKRKKELLLTSIEDIYNTTSNTAYIDTALQDYLTSLHQIDIRLMNIDETIEYTQKALNGQYDKNKSNAFIEELSDYTLELERYTKEFTKNVSDVIRETTLMNVSYFKVLNKVNKSLGVIISLILGIITGFVSGLIWGYIEEKREEQY